MKVSIVNGKTTLTREFKPKRTYYELAFRTEENKTYEVSMDGLICEIDECWLTGTSPERRYETSVFAFSTEEGCAEEFMASGDYWHNLSPQAVMETPYERIEGEFEAICISAKRMDWLKTLLLQEMPFLREILFDPTN